MNFPCQLASISADPWVVNVIQNGHQVDVTSLPPTGNREKTTVILKEDCKREAWE